jgi:hypothetical protein
VVDDEQLEPHWKEGSPTKKMKQLSANKRGTSFGELDITNTRRGATFGRKK